MAALLSGSDVDWPSPEEAVAEFEDALAADLAESDIPPEQTRLRVLLGIA